MKAMDRSAADKFADGDQLYRTCKIVWIALTVAIVSYFVVAISLKPIAVAENAAVERVLMALAAAYVAVSVPAKRWLLTQAAEVQSVTLRQFALIVPLVLCEVAAVTGLALRFVTGSTHYYVFLVLALVGMALHYPKKGE